ncbi:hypothetical protein SMICM304S_08684 [Streptomyces microflavus]
MSVTVGSGINRCRAFPQRMRRFCAALAANPVPVVVGTAGTVVRLDRRGGRDLLPLPAQPDAHPRRAPRGAACLPLRSLSAGTPAAPARARAEASKRRAWRGRRRCRRGPRRSSRTVTRSLAPVLRSATCSSATGTSSGPARPAQPLAGAGPEVRSPARRRFAGPRSPSTPAGSSGGHPVHRGPVRAGCARPRRRRPVDYAGRTSWTVAYSLGALGLLTAVTTIHPRLPPEPPAARRTEDDGAGCGRCWSTLGGMRLARPLRAPPRQGRRLPPAARPPSATGSSPG